MKRTLSMIALAVLTVGLLGSCSKINERLDNLDKRVDGIENEQIATITVQIAGIESSIADLKQIRDDIGNLKQSAESHGEDIFALQEADETLGNRIDNLEDYIENVLPNYAEKEWVEATYSTLEQYDSTCTAIAQINVKIGELDTKIAKDIETCVDSMKTWVNEQLDAYYTAAKMDAELAKMRASIDSAKAAGKISDTKADSVARELTKTKTAVDTAKSHIRSEYKAAIKAAIDSTEGRLTKKIQEEITKVNDRIDVLADRVTNLGIAVDALERRVDNLEKMIQSVKIIPEYANGSVRVEEDTLYIDCVIAPSAAVEGLTKDKVRILLNKVQTKAVALDTVHTDSIKVFETYKENGTVSIKANIPEIIAELGDESLTVAVNVKVTHSDKLASDVTSDFVPVKINPILYLPGVFTVGKGPDGVEGTDDDVKVKFSRGNLRAKKIGGQWDWGFYENQYGWNSLYPEYEVEETVYFTNENEIDKFTWGYGSWSNSPFAYDYLSTHATGEETLSPSEDWGAAMDNKGTWRTLTIGEWRYLLSYKTTEDEIDVSIDSTNDTRKELSAKFVTVMGRRNCLILYPDGYEKSKVVEEGDEDSYNTEEKWLAAQAEGVVCLPAAGVQFGLMGDDQPGVNHLMHYGVYWSSTFSHKDDDEYLNAYLVGFGRIFEGTDGEGKYLTAWSCEAGITRKSVRLVTDVK